MLKYIKVVQTDLLETGMAQFSVWSAIIFITLSKLHFYPVFTVCKYVEKLLISV